MGAEPHTPRIHRAADFRYGSAASVAHQRAAVSSAVTDSRCGVHLLDAVIAVAQEAMDETL